MKVIDKIIKYYEQEAIDFALGGSDEEAERAKGIASKYTEMKYNGHTHSLRMEIKDKWEKK
tara:strand:+ start:52 stop:234 length:183 start_codon:yes stop_codon:yes gene_type:complete